MLKNLILILMFNSVMFNIAFAETKGEINNKCQVDPGIGMSLEVNDRDFFVDNHQNCFLVLRSALYEFLLATNADLGLSIPVSYTDKSNNVIKCFIEYTSNSFVPAEMTDGYIEPRAAEIKSEKDAQKLVVDFILEKNKEGLDSSVPLFCEFLSF